ncbi:hypothetical protein K9M79_04215 [Candidatus Woesearchaeota archaeon]|nr:hypothetical protein [Candidatus Woesearchaeota archaeon]
MSKKTDIIQLEIERSKIKREVSMFVLNKGLLLYLCFLFVAVIGYMSENLTKTLFNLLIIMGLCVLIIATLPYILTLRKEEVRIDRLLETEKMRQK